MKKQEHTYSVTIDTRLSMEYKVKASSAAEARKKAWKKFSNRPPKRLFRFFVDKWN